MSMRPSTPAAEEIIGRYFPVLDHGFVALVDYMGTDGCIESAARVSFGHGTRQTSETRQLLRYLRRHQHTSPSEMVELKFHCSMPMFVARQWIRHRTANVSEYSGRYSLLPMQFYMPTPSRLQTQSTTNKQGSSGSGFSMEQCRAIESRWTHQRMGAAELYEWLTEIDLSRELARIDLPLSTYTSWYWKIDVHNLLHFLKLRVDSHAQWEFQEYGKVMAGILKRVAPITYEAFIDYDVCGARFSRMELELVRRLMTPGVDLDDAMAAGLEFGMSSREIAEFREKLEPRAVPDFELDLTKAHRADYFAGLAQAAVPKVDQPSSGS